MENNFSFCHLGFLQSLEETSGIRRVSRRHYQNLNPRFLILWFPLFPWWLPNWWELERRTGGNCKEFLHCLYQTLSVNNILLGDYLTTSICRTLYSLQSTFTYIISAPWQLPCKSGCLEKLPGILHLWYFMTEYLVCGWCLIPQEKTESGFFVIYTVFLHF